MGSTYIEKNCDLEMKVILHHIDRLFAEEQQKFDHELCVAKSKFCEFETISESSKKLVSTLEDELKELRAQNLSLEAQLSDTISKHNLNLKQLETDSEIKSRKIADLERQLAHAHNTLKKLQKEENESITSMKHKLVTYESKIKELEKSLSNSLFYTLP